jgi:hypothetical protein
MIIAAVIEIVDGHAADYIGQLYGVIREVGETDIAYRDRILVEFKNKLYEAYKESNNWMEEHLYD